MLFQKVESGLEKFASLVREIGCEGKLVSSQSVPAVKCCDLKLTR